MGYQIIKFILLVLWTNLMIPTSIGAGNVTYTDDSVIIEVFPSETTRQKRQSNYNPAAWLEALGEGTPCISSNDVLGACLSLRHCYPYIKYDEIVSSSWLYDQNSCSYYDENAEAVNGVCCTESTSSMADESTETSYDPVNENIESSQSQEVSQEITQEGSVESSDEFQESSENKNFYEHTSWQQLFTPTTPSSQWPPPVPTHPPSSQQWPPPIPTHPPDHHYPTHPPTSTYPSYPTRPSSTFPTRPISTYPTYPSSRPTSRPTRPTFPPTTRPIYRPITTFPTIRPTTRPPTRPPSYPTYPISSKPPSRPPTTTLIPSRPTSPVQHYSCGARSSASLDQERIVGGQNSSPGEYPWMVVLFNKGRQFCGGSLIDNVHVVTAAHCVATMSSWDVAGLTAHLGDHNIRTPYEVKHVERKIKRLVRHKGFEFSTLHNDVAVLTLDKPVTFTNEIRPICLPIASKKSYHGQVATVAGWGSLRENGPQPSILQKVSIPIWNNQECARKYGRAAPGGIIESMICAGQASRDSCSGDSGGPLMLNEGGRWTQIGIVSWGIGCGKGQYPGVYTRISSYLQWIMKNLKH